MEFTQSARKRPTNDPDYEPFTMENDYEEGHFDEETGEFYFKSEKPSLKRKKMTKEDHIYGDFNNVRSISAYLNTYQNNSFWDNRDFSQNNQFGKLEDYGNEAGQDYLQSKGFTGGVSFVRSKDGPSNKQASQPQKSKDTHSTKMPVNKKKTVRFNDEPQVKEISNNEQNRFNQTMNFSKGNTQMPEEEKQYVPTVTFGKQGSSSEQKSRRKNKEERKEEEKKQTKEVELEGKYGKGLKMLQKMGGFKVGQGLGKMNQGIINPVEAQANKNKSCLGGDSDKPEKKQKKEAQKEETAADKEEQIKEKIDKEDADFLKLLYLSKKQGGKIPTRNVSGKEKFQQVNDQFFTINKNAGIKIIDMRGAQSQGEVISDLGILKQRAENIYQAQQVSVAKQPKIQKFKLVDSINSYKEQIKIDLQSVINKKSYHESKLLQLKYEQENVQGSIRNQQDNIALLLDFKNEVQRLVAKVPSDIHKEDALLLHCKEIHERFREFYSQFAVSMVVVKEMLKEMKKQVASWNILQSPLLMFEDFYQIRNILTIGTENVTGRNDRDQIKSSTYQTEDVLYWVFDNHWLPPVRAFLMTKWNVKEDSIKILDGLVQWSHLFPEKFLDKLIENFIKPRLKREIDDNWNPKDVSSPSNMIQNWFLPWQKLLTQQDMQSFIISIKLKITTALSEWKPDSPLAKELLLPFRSLIDPRSFESMLQRVVIHKIISQIKNMEINPEDQDISPIQNFIEWVGIVDTPTLAQILRENLFMKWIQTLQEWLEQTEDKSLTTEEKESMFEEIAQWYEGWKNLIPEEIREQDNIKEVFALALELIGSKLED